MTSEIRMQTLSRANKDRSLWIGNPTGHYPFETYSGGPYHSDKPLEYCHYQLSLNNKLLWIWKRGLRD